MTTPEEVAALRADTRPLNDAGAGSFCDHNEAFRYANSRCLLSNLARSYLNLHGRFLQEPWTADATVGGQPLQVPAVSDILAQRKTIGDIAETWLIDGKPSPISVLIRVSDINSITGLKDHLIVRKGDNIGIPIFSVTLRGVGHAFSCCREDSASLISAKPFSSSNFAGLLEVTPQPPSSPTRIATQKFHDDLVIAWAESIKAQRT